MDFFSTRHGDLHPVSRIRRIGPLPKRDKDKEAFEIRYRLVTMDDGDQVYASEFEIADILSQPAKIIPAAPGTFMLSGLVAGCETTADLWQTPIIAWGLAMDGTVKPWTVDGPDDGLSHPGPILMSNGMVQTPHDSNWRSLDDWFAEESERLRSPSPKAEEE